MLKPILFFFWASLLPISVHALTVDTLRCDFRDAPAGIDSAQPLLSWLPESQTRGDTVTAYQIQVATSAAGLASGGNLWDSGKVASNQNAHILYGGAPLSSYQQVFWQVRLWDGNGVATAWSVPATWTMGVLNVSDWSGSWIAATRASNGYHAVPSGASTGSKWVQVDLGSAKAISSVRLDPTNYLSNTSVTGTTAYGFPVQFVVQASSNDSTFTTGTTTIYQTGAHNYPNPGLAVVSFPASVTARYVRVTASVFYNCPGNSIDGSGNNYVFSLSQLEVISGGVNAAVGKAVSTSDGGIQENSTWSNAGLTDGIGYVGFPGVTQSDRFRTAFSVTSGLTRAVVNICGLGHYQMTINGTNVTTNQLTPNWSAYNKTCYYNSYDVTALLQAGNNAAGITLGNGMYNVTGGRYTRFTGSFGPRKVIAQIRLEYSNGSVTTIGTNPSTWQWNPGPMTFCCIYGGEDRDRRLDPAGWDTAAFNSASWQAPVTSTAPSGAIMRGDSLDATPVRFSQTFTPVNSWVIGTGTTVYDFGQNASSMPTITVSGSAGTSVKLTPCELINSDHTLNQQYAPVYMTYTLAGSGTETYTPTFFYFGYRYVQVELQNAKGSTTAAAGAPVPVLDSITSSSVTSSPAATGTFSSSNGLFNQIYSLIAWAQFNNMMGYMTDCPQREKLGWLEEDHLNGPGLRYVHGMSALFTKIEQDIADTQTPGGSVYTTAPRYVAQSPPAPTYYDTSPEWGSTFIIGAWQQYQFDGDAVLLSRYYAGMKAYVNYLTTTASNYILPGGLGDWANLDNNLTPTNLTSTATYYQDAVTLSDIAAVLGNSADAAAYKQLAANIASAFNATFYNSAAGYYATDTETCNAMPLALGITPPENQVTVLNAIVEDLTARGFSFTFGEIGHPYVLDALANNGRSDVVFAMHTRLTSPSYGYILSLGATSLTEAWTGAYSQDHFMIGHLMNWFYHDLAGIQPDPAGPGFKKIIIMPAMIGNVSWNNASYLSVSGTIVSNWTHGPNGLTMNVTIPPGSTATVYVPAANASLVQESGVPATSAPNVQYLEMVNGAAVYAVGSGSYSFSSVDTAQAPTSLAASGSNGQVTLSWVDSVNASSYTIERSTINGSGYVTIASGVAGPTYSDTNVTNGITYYYLVTGSNAAGTGAWAAASGTPQIIADAGFESPLVSTYAYDLVGSPWTFSGSPGSGSGISANGSDFTATTGTAPEGTQAAFVQGTGSFSQVINGLIPGMTYSLRFSAAERATNNNGGQTWNVTMNGATVGSYAPLESASTYTAYTAAFTAVAASETLSFVGTDTRGGDNTVFIDNLLISSPSPIPAGSTSIGNGGFEVPSTSTYAYNPSGGIWTFTASAGANGSGISANGSGFTATTGSAPQGTQVAFLQGTASITQSLSGLVPGASYTLSFLAAERATNNNGGETWSVTVNGATIASYAPLASATTYTAYTAAFTATTGTETLAFAGTNARGGDNTVFIDNVILTAPAPAAPTGLTQTYLSETQVLLTWVDNASNATGYIVERSPAGANNWTVLTDNLPPGATSYQDNNLLASTSYDYVVMAIGPSAFSTTDSITVTTPAGVGDGIPGWWRLQYFGNGLSAAGAAAWDADPDGDGMTNYQEYLAGTDPTNRLSVLQITAVTPSRNDLVVTFSSVDGKLYQLQRAAALGTPTSWVPIQNNIEGTGNPISITDPGAASLPACFYRVMVNPP